jgi:hypothetical protein
LLSNSTCTSTNWAYSPAVATWVVAMGFIAWAALAAAIPTALGRQVQTTGLLVAIAVFGLSNPYAISEVGLHSSSRLKSVDP